MTGTSFAEELRALPTWKARSQRMLEHVRAGDVPSFIRDKFWRWVESRAVIDGKVRVLRMLVAPDFLSVGADDDFLIFGPTPAEAQAMADTYGAILPSRKLSNLIRAASTRKLPLSDVKGPPTNVPLSKIETIDAVLAARTIDKLHGYDPNQDFVSGQRKDIVIGPGLDGRKLAISGGGGGSYYGWAIQPYSTIHGSDYGDYSQGERLISLKSLLDDTPVDLSTIFTDPKLHVLVSDQGPFVPRFPNAGPGAGSPPLPSSGAPSGSPSMPPASKPPAGSGFKPVVNRPASQGGSLLAVGIAAAAVALLAGAAS